MKKTIESKEGRHPHRNTSIKSGHLQNVPKTYDCIKIPINKPYNIKYNITILVFKVT